MGAPEALVRKENRALLAYPGTKDKLAQRALKETTDQQGLSVPKQMRVSKDHQVSQDHQVDQVLPAKVEGKGSQASKVKKEMMALTALRDQLDLQALQAPLGSWAPLALRGWMERMGNQGCGERQAPQAQQDREQSQDSKGKPAILASLDRRVNLDLQAPLDHQAGQDMMVTPGPQDLRADLDLPATLAHQVQLDHQDHLVHQDWV